VYHTHRQESTHTRILVDKMSDALPLKRGRVESEDENEECTYDLGQEMPYEDQAKFSGLFAEKTGPGSNLCNYRVLGRSGLRVSPLCLSTFAFGKEWGAMIGEMEKMQAKEVFLKYVELGGNFIDTALNYQQGQSTKWLGEWIKEKGNRDSLVIAAKYSLTLDPDDVNSGGNHRKCLRRTVRQTLDVLGVKYIDILYVHAFDHVTPVEEMMSTLNDLVRCGDVLYLGVSETPAWIVSRANTLASQHGWAPFVVYQGKYTPAERDSDAEIIPMCDAMGLSFVPWALQPWCSRYGDDYTMPVPTKSDPPNCPEIDAAIIKVAKEIGCTPTQVVLAWVLRKPSMASVLLTCKSVDALESCVKSLSIRLTPKQAMIIEKASLPKPGYPYKYIGRSYQTSPLFASGGTISTPTKPFFQPPH